MATKLSQVIELGVRRQGESTLQSVSLLDLIGEFEAKQFRFTYQKSTDVQRMHIIDENGEYLAIKLGKSVELSSANERKMFVELLNDYTVYYGTVTVADKDEEGEPIKRSVAWFTFGRLVDLDDSEVFDISDLMPKKDEKKGKTNKISAA
jgi:hypothetical protein